MALLRSGLTMFVVTTSLATLLTSGLFFGQAWWFQGWSPNPDYLWTFARLTSIVTAPAYLVLMLAARLGRRRPALDGALAIAGIGFVLCAISYYCAYTSDDWVSSSYAGMAWAGYFVVLTTVVPAHFISYFALHRTPLLHGLVPLRT